MLNYLKRKGNLIHKTAVVNWKYIEIGKNNIIGPYTVIGNVAQHPKQKSSGKIIIGNNNTFRENVTVNTGTQGGGLFTRIQDNCLFMVGSHIAHDCIIGSNVILANNATLAGHVEIDNNSIIGGIPAKKIGEVILKEDGTLELSYFLQNE